MDKKNTEQRIRLYSLIAAIVLVSQAFSGVSTLKTLSALALGLAAFIEYKRLKNSTEGD